MKILYFFKRGNTFIIAVSTTKRRILSNGIIIRFLTSLAGMSDINASPLSNDIR